MLPGRKEVGWRPNGWRPNQGIASLRAGVGTPNSLGVLVAQFSLQYNNHRRSVKRAAVAGLLVDAPGQKCYNVVAEAAWASVLSAQRARMAVILRNRRAMLIAWPWQHTIISPIPQGVVS